MQASWQRSRLHAHSDGRARSHLPQGWQKSLALTVGVGGTTSALICTGLGIAYSEKHDSLIKATEDKIQSITNYLCNQTQSRINRGRTTPTQYTRTVSSFRQFLARYTTEVHFQLPTQANAGIWLDKAKTITSEDKTRLLEQYRKIQEYC
ncbi:hypothetical protein NUACC26_040630 [Scytonema sp. NUACC26]